MVRNIVLILSVIFSFSALADTLNDRKSIERAVLDYIESQHKAKSELMERGLDKNLPKEPIG